MMKGYAFDGLLQEEDWIMPAYVDFDESGALTSINRTPQIGLEYEEVKGFAIPSFTNAHSHAFQYAMVGLTERHNKANNNDNFWSWRNAMYKIALKISPDQMEAIAAKLYSEMIRHGYSHVVEFHYVHHDVNGYPYDNKAELGERLVAAAKTAGIKITLVPIFYQKGGFGKPANHLQRRFISSNLEEYLQLYNSSEQICKHYNHANIGIGPHSLRAVEPQLIIDLAAIHSKDIPFHIHVSEQLKEVEESIHTLGKRPAQWMLDNIAVDSSFNFVHCTHLNDTEIEQLAGCGANVVLCPSTEGNLGDGIFPLPKYQNLDGRWCIGTDSQIGLNPFEDLRILDYGQRTKSHMRKTFYSSKQEDSGSYAINKIIANGRHATGNTNKVYFKIGQPFDALIIDSQIPILQMSSPLNLTSTIVYSSDAHMHKGTIINGKWIVVNGKNQEEVAINESFIKALSELKTR